MLVSSADETAFEVARTIGVRHDRQGVHRWLSSGDCAWFREMGRRLLGPEIDTVEAVTWA